MLRLSMVAVVGVSGLAGVSAVGCGFVPGIGPWFDTRYCFGLGFVLGKLLG